MHGVILGNFETTQNINKKLSEQPWEKDQITLKYSVLKKKWNDFHHRFKKLENNPNDIKYCRIPYFILLLTRANLIQVFFRGHFHMRGVFRTCLVPICFCYRQLLQQEGSMVFKVTKNMQVIPLLHCKINNELNSYQMCFNNFTDQKLQYYFLRLRQLNCMYCNEQSETILF